MEPRKTPEKKSVPAKKPNPLLFWQHADKAKSNRLFFNFKRDKAEKPIDMKASAAAQNAKAAAHLSLPLITAAGIEMLGDKGGYISLAPLGIPVTVGGIVLDTVKAPFCLAVATEESIRAGVMKLASVIFERQSPSAAQVDRIFKSFLLRMRDTATLLVALGLEDVDVLNTKLKSGDIEDLVALTLLHTAYASRNYYGGLVMANDTVLDRGDCPVEGLKLYDQLMKLKSTIHAALKPEGKSDLIKMGTDQQELEDSRKVCEWIIQIKAGKLITVENYPTTNLIQIEIINNIIQQIADLKQSAMEVLPHAPEVVASKMPSMKM